MWGCGCLPFPLQPISTLRFQVIIIIIIGGIISAANCGPAPRLHPLLLPAA